MKTKLVAVTHLRPGMKMVGCIGLGGTHHTWRGFRNPFYVMEVTGLPESTNEPDHLSRLRVPYVSGIMPNGSFWYPFKGFYAKVLVEEGTCE